MTDSATLPQKKRDPTISLMKGIGMVFIMLIHLIDWSDTILPTSLLYVKEIFYSGPLIFILFAGVIIPVAYGKKDLKVASWRLVSRGLQLIGVYYLYNIVKLAIYDFPREPFYPALHFEWTTVWNILIFKIATVPITILPTIGIFLIIAPILLWMRKRYTSSVNQETLASARVGKEVQKNNFGFFFGLAIISISIFNFLNQILQSSIFNLHFFDFLYSRNYVLFSIMDWLPIFLIGFSLGSLGLEKIKKPLLIGSGIVSALCIIFFFTTNQSLAISQYEFPPQPYYIVVSFFLTALLLYLCSVITKKSEISSSSQSAIFNLQSSISHFLKWLGDKSLVIYVGHWIAIDLVRLYFPPKAIWAGVIIYVGLSFLHETVTRLNGNTN